MSPRPRPQPWSWACAACLAALAAAFLWPAAQFPRLGPPDGLRIPQADARVDGGVPAPRTGGTQEPSRTGSAAGLAAGDDEARDAVADGPWRLKVQEADWTQAPWRVFWGMEPEQTASVPAPLALPRVYRRTSAGRPRAMPPSSEKRAPPRARPLPGAAAEVPAQEPPRPEAAPAPGRALSRMRELLARILAYRASAAGPAGSKPASGRRSARRASTAGGSERETSSRGARRAEAKPERLPRWRPVLLSRALGARAIRPPSFKGKPPDLARKARLFPKKGPDGRPLRWTPAPASALEKLVPPEAEAAKCRRSTRHWHPGLPAFHSGRAWAVGQAEGWAWLERAGKRWWAWTAPQEPIWLRHEDHWWWRSQDVWFMLHQGEAWGYRVFSERQSEGLVHPASGTRMEYSRDGERAALVTPGDGAWLFDARSGAVLHRWTEEQMPRKPKPRAPSALSFPR